MYECVRTPLRVVKTLKHAEMHRPSSHVTLNMAFKKAATLCHSMVRREAPLALIPPTHIIRLHKSKKEKKHTHSVSAAFMSLVLCLV